MDDFWYELWGRFKFEFIVFRYESKGEFRDKHRYEYMDEFRIHFQDELRIECRDEFQDAFSDECRVTSGRNSGLHASAN